MVTWSADPPAPTPALRGNAEWMRGDVQNNPNNSSAPEPSSADSSSVDFGLPEESHGAKFPETEKANSIAFPTSEHVPISVGKVE